MTLQPAGITALAVALRMVAPVDVSTYSGRSLATLVLKVFAHALLLAYKLTNEYRAA